MAEVTLSNQARQDLLAIWEYIAEDNFAAADRVLDTLDERMQLLADQPFLGPARPDIARDLRYLVSENYLILYRVTGDVAEIVRVLHGARNLRALFKDDEQSP
jgi:toxin ParE1/3/4